MEKNQNFHLCLILLCFFVLVCGGCYSGKNMFFVLSSLFFSFSHFFIFSFSHFLIFSFSFSLSLSQESQTVCFITELQSLCFTKQAIALQMLSIIQRMKWIYMPLI